jgi:molecular chaperone DnaK (HSP70)
VTIVEGNAAVMRLGIDFGTTRTVVSAGDQGRYPVAAFETAEGFSDYLSGHVVQTAAGLSFGAEATSRFADAGVRVVRSVKRAVTGLAPEDPVPGLDGIGALHLVTEYLKWVKRSLIADSNLDIGAQDVLEAMVAVPANASTRQRFLTLEAFRAAGFVTVGMVNEPTAAAIEFAHRNLGAVGRRSPKRYVVVYDLGGGTFDSSAVSLVGRRFDLLNSEGIARLGGEDLDALVLELALKSAGRPDELTDSQRARALTICREAKESLTSSSRRLLVDLREILELDEPCVLETSELYACAQPLVERTVELTARVFSSLTARGIDPENPRELGAIYLVGGASAFPPVPRTLRQLYGRKIQLAPQPHAATAVGLAIAADPDAELFVREAATRHFGVWREADGGREKVFDPILRKDTAVPEDSVLKVVRSYSPVHSVGHLRFVECSELNVDGQPAGDLTPWGEILFPYDPALRDAAELLTQAVGRRGEVSGQEIVETYQYGDDGLITVDIENRSAGYRHTSRLTGPA